MKIQVLGPGCPKCRQLAANVESAVKELGLAAEVEKVTDLKEIVKFGLLTTPGLVVEGQLRSYGKVLSVEEIKRILS